MSSHLHTEPIRTEQRERPRGLRTTGRRGAAAFATGLALALSVGCGAAGDPAHKTVAQAADSATLVGASAPRTSQAFVLRIRELETRGYVQASCSLSGILMVNPRTHRSEMVVA